MEQPRKTPANSAMRRAIRRNPRATNVEWAEKWGVSRERVRQIRIRLGLPASSIVQKELRKSRVKQKEAERMRREAVLSDRLCPVDGLPVPEIRLTTCSSVCAREYRSNSKYRWRQRAQQSE